MVSVLYWPLRSIAVGLCPVLTIVIYCCWSLSCIDHCDLLLLVSVLYWPLWSIVVDLERLPSIELLTDGLIFIGSISHVYLWCYNFWASSKFLDLMDYILKTWIWVERVGKNSLNKWRCILHKTVTVYTLTGFSNIRSFVLPSNGSAAFLFFLSACGFRHQIRSLNCCPRIQSITVYFAFLPYLFSLIPFLHFMKSCFEFQVLILLIKMANFADILSCCNT